MSHNPWKSASPREVYFDRTRSGREGLFIDGLLIFGVQDFSEKEWEHLKSLPFEEAAEELACRLNVKLVQRHQEINDVTA